MSIKLMNEEEVLRILERTGAIITNSHIVYTSGKHGADYINKDALYLHTKETSLLSLAIAEKFANDEVEVVIAPAIGGVVLSQWIAYNLTEITKKEVLSAYAEKTEDKNILTIRRGYDKIIFNRNVLAVEDILNTSTSAKKLIDAVRLTGGKVIGLGAIFNRGGVESRDVSDPPKFFSLVNLKLEVWDEAVCPLCLRKVQINTDIGKGREFLAKKQS